MTPDGLSDRFTSTSQAHDDLGFWAVGVALTWRYLRREERSTTSLRCVVPTASLCQRTLDDMLMRGLDSHAQEGYIFTVK